MTSKSKTLMARGARISLDSPAGWLGVMPMPEYGSMTRDVNSGYDAGP